MSGQMILILFLRVMETQSVSTPDDSPCARKLDIVLIYSAKCISSFARDAMDHEFLFVSKLPFGTWREMSLEGAPMIIFMALWCISMEMVKSEWRYCSGLGAECMHDIGVWQGIGSICS